MHKVFFIMVLMITIPAAGQKVVTPDSKAGEGYYTGHYGLFVSVYVKVSRDKAIADYIYSDKFPRDMYSDTLLASTSENGFESSYSRLYQENGRYWLTNEKNGTIWGNKKIRLKADEKGYRANLDKNKNYAAFNKYFTDYINEFGKDKDARQRFWHIYETKQFGQEIEKLRFEEFLVKLAEFKKEVTAGK